MSKDKITKRNDTFRKQYHHEHGHYPEDHMAKIDCTQCQILSLHTHMIITHRAGAQNCDEIIDKTGYSREVKEAVKALMKDSQ